MQSNAQLSYFIELILYSLFIVTLNYIIESSWDVNFVVIIVVVQYQIQNWRYQIKPELWQGKDYLVPIYFDQERNRKLIILTLTGIGVARDWFMFIGWFHSGILGYNKHKIKSNVLPNSQRTKQTYTWRQKRNVLLKEVKTHDSQFPPGPEWLEPFHFKVILIQGPPLIKSFALAR